MSLMAEELYDILSDERLKGLTDLFQDGFTGMYVVLKILDDAGKNLSAGDISEMFGVTSARTAVILSTLEKKGYVIKEKNESDARKTNVKITDLGKQALEDRKKEIVKLIDCFLSRLTDIEKKNIISIINKFIN